MPVPNLELLKRLSTACQPMNAFIHRHQALLSTRLNSSSNCTPSKPSPSAGCRYSYLGRELLREVVQVG